jgi:hypothetical protein
MKYNNDELKIINEWLTSLAVQHLVDEDFFEYKDGQLLEFAKAKEGSLLTWDEWQHLQTMMDMEIPLKLAIRFVDILWENDIEVLEMNTTKVKSMKSKEYEEKCNKIYACSKTKDEILEIITEQLKKVNRDYDDAMQNSNEKLKVRNQGRYAAIVDLLHKLEI